MSGLPPNRCLYHPLCAGPTASPATSLRGDYLPKARPDLSNLGRGWCPDEEYRGFPWPKQHAMHRSPQQGGKRGVGTKLGFGKWGCRSLMSAENLVWARISVPWD